MKILEEPAFIIKKENNNCFLFYNSIRHFVCRLSELDLIIFNLIYTYHDYYIIKENLDKQYIPYFEGIYNATVKSRALSMESLNTSTTASLIYPSTYYLHLTYKCNLDCIYCYNKEIRTHFEDLKLEEWKSIIEKISPYAKRIILTGGEPFLSNKLADIIRYIRDQNTSVDIEIISNCMTNFEHYPYVKSVFEHINKITFSCDNITGKNQQRINFNSNLFKYNINYIRTQFKNLAVTISSVYSKGNYSELKKIKSFSSKENVTFKSVLMVPNNINDVSLLPLYDEFIKTLPKLSKKIDIIRKYCGAGMGVLSIDPQGNVYPCQSLHSEKFKLGNLLTNSLNTILKNPLLKYIKEYFNIDYIPVCKDCNLKYICAGGCRAATLNTETDPTKYPRILCKYYKAMAMNKLSNIPLENQDI